MRVVGVRITLAFLIVEAVSSSAVACMRFSQILEIIIPIWFDWELLQKRWDQVDTVVSIPIWFDWEWL